jgi:hypothetical protein
MTKLVQQRNLTDCVICSLAMATDLSYETVLEKVGDLYDIKEGLRYESKALNRLGFSNEYENGQSIGDFTTYYRGFYISPEFFLSTAWGRRALLSVPSLNFAGKWHMLYVDGRKVYDPSTLDRYERYDQLKPEYITVFREGLFNETLDLL